MQTVEQWPLDRLRAYERNPRVNDHAVDQTAAAIGKFGFRVPILAKSDGLIIDGHLRLKAARKLGLSTVPVLLADDMSDTVVRAFRLSVNKIADLATWDFELLASELDDLQEVDFDLPVIGFTRQELNDLLETPLSASASSAVQSNYSEQYGVIAICADEAEQERIYNEMVAAGYNCRVVAT